jgi:hypothetical protein
VEWYAYAQSCALRRTFSISAWRCLSLPQTFNKLHARFLVPRANTDDIFWGRYWNASVALEYTGLEPTARYSVRVVYKKGGDAGKAPPTMTAAGADGKSVLVHGELNVTQTAPYEFSVPQEATKGGSVTLSCHGPLGVGGMGRCCQMAEVWLLKS